MIVGKKAFFRLVLHSVEMVGVARIPEVIRGDIRRSHWCLLSELGLG
jgi:hypothetical protein